MWYFDLWCTNPFKFSLLLLVQRIRLLSLPLALCIRGPLPFCIWLQKAKLQTVCHTLMPHGNAAAKNNLYWVCFVPLAWRHHVVFHHSFACSPLTNEVLLEGHKPNQTKETFCRRSTHSPIVHKYGRLFRSSPKPWPGSRWSKPNLLGGAAGCRSLTQLPWPPLLPKQQKKTCFYMFWCVV